MRYPGGVKYAPGALLLLATAGCPTSGTVPLPDASADDASLGIVTEGDGGSAQQPLTTPPCADMAHCISGTAALDPSFLPGSGCLSPQCDAWQVDLFAQYPAAGVQPIAPPALVAASDGSWAFDGVGADGGPQGGYYVKATARFVFAAGKSVVSSVVGPLTLPATSLSLTVGPLQAVAYEARRSGGSMFLDWALAHLYDPSTGEEITSDASVTISGAADGGTLALQPTTVGSSTYYYAAFAQPPPAQPTYTITASHPAFGDAGVAVVIVAAPPSFDGTITSIDAGSSGITVAWTPEPQASYEIVDLYAATADGGWNATPAYQSPTLDPPSRTSETTPPLEAGTYLVNVAYTVANCSADAGGCVQASTVAAQVE
jgi:hypothetical protein